MSDGASDRQFIKQAAGYLTVATVLVAFGVSAMTLSALGIMYDQPGGNFLHKLHPATWMACFALAANLLWRPDRFAYLAALPARFPGAAYFVAMWAIMILYAPLVQHAPIMPLVDTFFCAVAFLILYTDAEDSTRRAVRIALHALLFVNACVGIGEFVTHMRLTPFVTGGKTILHDYRSTAILGHPLINSGTAAAYILTLFFGGDRSIGLLARAAMIAVQAAALVTFGGRTAIVVCAALAAVGSLRPLADVICGRRFDMRIALVAAVAAPLAAGAIVAAISGGYLDKFIERFIDDRGSAQARVVMFQLFDYFTLDEILIGPDPARLAVLQNTLGIEYGIENSWLGFVFQYGALMSGFFITGFFALVWDISRRTQPAAWALVIYFVIQATSAAGISVKSFMFDQFAIMLLAILGAPRPSEAVAESAPRNAALVSRRA